MALSLSVCSRHGYGKDDPCEKHQFVPVPLPFCVHIKERVEMEK
jgi:hypothetical protein